MLQPTVSLVLRLAARVYHHSPAVIGTTSCMYTSSACAGRPCASAKIHRRLCWQAGSRLCSSHILTIRHRSAAPRSSAIAASHYCRSQALLVRQCGSRAARHLILVSTPGVCCARLKAGSAHLPFDLPLFAGKSTTVRQFEAGGPLRSLASMSDVSKTQIARQSTRG